MLWAAGRRRCVRAEARGTQRRRGSRGGAETRRCRAVGACRVPSCGVRGAAAASPTSSSRRTSGPMVAMPVEVARSVWIHRKPWVPAFAGMTDAGGERAPRTSSATPPRLRVSASPRLRTSASPREPPSSLSALSASARTTLLQRKTLRTKPPSPARSPCSCRGWRRDAPSVPPSRGPCPSCRSRRVRP